jgi:serine/threonine-protein kinase
MTGTLSVNAQPWAEVWVDGQRIGETPIGNLSLPIGHHELVVRHPQLGERRQTVAVGANGPSRIGIDLRR